MGYTQNNHQKQKQNGDNNTQLICSNPNCIPPSKNVDVKLVKFCDTDRPFCIQCRDSIQNQWVCYYCHTIFREQIDSDNSEWVGCDNNKCTRWTHIDCEAKKGVIQIKQIIKNMSANYYCPICRNTKPKNSKNFFNKNKEKLPNFYELKKFMISKKKKMIVINQQKNYLIIITT